MKRIADLFHEPVQYRVEVETACGTVGKLSCRYPHRNHRGIAAVRNLPDRIPFQLELFRTHFRCHMKSLVLLLQTFPFRRNMIGVFPHQLFVDFISRAFQTIGERDVVCAVHVSRTAATGYHIIGTIPEKGHLLDIVSERQRFTVVFQKHHPFRRNLPGIGCMFL